MVAIVAAEGVSFGSSALKVRANDPDASRASADCVAEARALGRVCDPRWSVGTGFVTADPRFGTGESPYALITALHVLRRAGFSSKRVEVTGPKGQVVLTTEYLGWPGQDLAVVPLRADELRTLGATPLAVGSRQRLTGLAATLALWGADSPSGRIAGEVGAGAYADAIEVAGGRYTTTLRRLDGPTQLVVTKMRTRNGMSGAPLLLGPDGPVIAVHLMGVAQSDSFHEVAFAISLLDLPLGEPTRAADLPPANPDDEGPSLQQSDIEYLPDDIRRRLAKLRGLFGVPDSDQDPDLFSAFVYLFGSLPVRSDLVPGSSRIGILFEKFPRSLLPVEIGRFGFSVSLMLNLNYAREVRNIGGATGSMSGLGFATSLGPCAYWANPEAMSGFALALGPVLDGVAFHLHPGQEPGEHYFGYGALVSARYFSVPGHLSLAVHASVESRAVGLYRLGASGRELGLELGLGVGPAW